MKKRRVFLDNLTLGEFLGGTILFYACIISLIVLICYGQGMWSAIALTALGTYLAIDAGSHHGSFFQAFCCFFSAAAIGAIVLYCRGYIGWIALVVLLPTIIFFFFAYCGAFSFKRAIDGNEKW